MNWVNSALGRDYWRALVNEALKLRVPKAMELVSIQLYREVNSKVKMTA